VPEGDTIHRAAARLAPALEGRELLGFEVRKLQGTRPRVGETIESVAALGKHLLIGFSGGLTLDTHMGMGGSWSVVEAGGRPRQARHLLRVRLVVTGREAHCYSAPTIRTYPTEARATPLDHLGPDLMDPAADLELCLARWAELAAPDAVVADVLLDQRIANGIGNVFVSETCWRRLVQPSRPASELDDDGRRALLADASRLLRANAPTSVGAQRRTVPGGLAAYGRRGQGCRRCGTRIASGRVGRQQRVAYWCPHCQPVGGGPVR
jgi:endonuclease-8